MNDEELAAQRFETHRAYLRGIAFRMLGSADQADDAVREARQRLTHEGTAVADIKPWLTTVVARVCLDMLRVRNGRTEVPDQADDDPVVDAGLLRHQAILADTASLAVLVALDRLTPTERLVYVLRDMFSVPFDEIAEIVGRTPEAARRLADRARRQVRGTDPGTVRG
jgi:RNA polymerase sigma-70 factor (ECF subfamily)